MVLYTGTKECTPQYRGVEQLVARRAHNPEVVGSSPASATTKTTVFNSKTVVFLTFHRVFQDLKCWLTPSFDTNLSIPT